MNKELNVSYEILSKVILEKSYVSIELNKYLNKSYGDYNTSLVTKIVYGVLEKDIMLEYFISQHVKKMPEAQFLILLKMVAYVSKAINSIPHFALVNEIVTISKKIDVHKSGFVNAVSKKLISSEIVLPDKKKITKYLSVRYNYPEWVISELLKKHDLEFVKSLVSCELTSLTHIRVNLDRISSVGFKAILNEREIRFEESFYDYTLYVDYAKLLCHNELKDFYVVQGLPSIITCNVLGAETGNVLDVCAAPGGKSVYLAHNKNINVYSADIHKHRVDLIKKYADSTGVKLKTFVQDATKINEEWLDKFDYVLCDVPCSNLGVSRKKPDVFLNKELADVKTLSGLQYQILENSAKYVKKNGILQYSTCTILDSENKNVVDKFLKNNPNFELTQIDFGELNIIEESNMYTFFPHLTKTEGFFIARLRRK